MRMSSKTAWERFVLGLLIFSASLLTACNGDGSSSSPVASGPSAPTVESLTITPQTAEFADGTTRQFSAKAEFSDGTTQDVTSDATWTSADTGITTIATDGDSSGDPAGLARGQSPGSTTISATYQGVVGQTGTDAVVVTSAVLTDLRITPQESSIPDGTTQQYTATGIFTDGSNQDLTDQVTWSSSAPAVAMVNANGLATGQGPGAVVIGAVFDTQSDSADLTVTDAVITDLQLTPGAVSKPKGQTQQFTATGIFSDGSTRNVTENASWSSADPAVATVDSQGLAKGVDTGGPVSISASFDGIQDSAQITVTDAVLNSLEVSPGTVSIPLGTEQQYTATGHFSDGSTENLTGDVTWESSNSDIATIDGTGLATSRDIGGPITITASMGDVQDSGELTVNAAALDRIEISPRNVELPEGREKPFTATGIYTDGSHKDLTSEVTWSSSDRDTADISNAEDEKGVATALSIGMVNISARLDGFEDITPLTVTGAVLDSIEVAPATTSVPQGRTQQFTATGLYSDNTTEDITKAVTWTSSDGTIATVSNADGSEGIATAEASTGEATIKAVLDGLEDTATMAATDAALDKIELEPLNATIADGTSLQYQATGVYSDGETLDITADVTWNSSTDEVAQVSNVGGNEGFALARSPGETEISATLEGVVGSTGLEVTDATLTGIQVEPDEKNLPNGYKLQFSATGFYTDGSNQDITQTATWSSSNTFIATISNADGNRGLAAADDLSTGTVTITASVGETTGNAVLEVTSATLTSISVDPASASIPWDPDSPEQFTASGNFSDGSSLAITEQVTWTSSDDTIAAISNAAGSKGLVTPTGEGAVTIQAQKDGTTGSASLEVTAAVLEQITIAPLGSTVAAGESEQFDATGIYSNGESRDITTTVSWNSDNSNVVINNSGKATTNGDAAGTTANITASKDGVISNTAVLNVTDATLVGIAVKTEPQGVTDTPAGTDVQYRAEGTYSDGTTAVDITQDVNWSLSEETPDFSGENVADISNMSGREGLLTTFNPGTVTVRATQGDVTSDGPQLTVNDALLTGVTVTPVNPEISLNTQQQFTATATYTDGSTSDITESADTSWTSDNPNTASVNNSDEKGLATGHSAGLAMITANFQGESGGTTLTVLPASLLSISITPANGSLPVNFSRQLTATGHYSDGSTQDITQEVTWSSFAGEVVVNNSDSKGWATGVSTGTDTVSASKEGITASTDLTVTSASLRSINLAPADAEEPTGTTIQYTATGVFDDASTLDITTQVLWTSSFQSVAAISNAEGSEGEAQTQLPGQTTISAEHTGTGVSGSTTLTVTLF